jgi:peptidoglycan lytic transglycosylase
VPPLPRHRRLLLKQASFIGGDRGNGSVHFAPGRFVRTFRPSRKVFRFARLFGLGAGCLALGHCTTDNVAGTADRKHTAAVSSRVLATGETAALLPTAETPSINSSVLRKRVAHATQAHAVPGNVNYSAVGMASWYGEDFHGRPTANGETFNMNSLSAAHPSLPLPCNVRVTNLLNHRSIVVRVNDRGPYVGGRVIDVSAKTAKVLGFYDDGLSKVKVEYVSRAH